MAFDFKMAILYVFRRTKREGSFNVEEQLCHIKEKNQTNTQIYSGTIFKSISVEQRQNNANLDHSGATCSHIQLSPVTPLSLQEFWL